jgi:hypothetical protein
MIPSFKKNEQAEKEYLNIALKNPLFRKLLHHCPGAGFTPARATGAGRGQAPPLQAGS